MIFCVFSRHTENVQAKVKAKVLKNIIHLQIPLHNSANVALVLLSPKQL